MLRRAAFKEAYIRKTIILEDIINSGKAVELGANKMIHSFYFPERNFDNRLDRFMGWV